MSKRRSSQNDSQQGPSRKKQRSSTSRNHNNSNNREGDDYHYKAPNPKKLLSNFAKMLDVADNVGYEVQENLEELVLEWNKNLRGYGITDNGDDEHNMSLLLDGLQEADLELMKQITGLAMETLLKINPNNNNNNNNNNNKQEINAIECAAKCSDFCLKKMEQQKHEKYKQFIQEKKERDQMSVSLNTFNSFNSFNDDIKLPPHSIKKQPKYDKLYHDGFIIEMSEPPIIDITNINISKHYENDKKSQSEKPPKMKIIKNNSFDRYKYQKRIKTWYYKNNDKMFGCGGNFKSFLGFNHDQNNENQEININ